MIARGKVDKSIVFYVKLLYNNKRRNAVGDDFCKFLLAKYIAF